MKLKLSDIVNAWPAAQSMATKKLKINPSFWVARQLRKIKSEMELYEDQRVELVRQHGEKKPDGNMHVPPGSEKWEAFQAEHRALLEEMVEVAIEQRPATYLGDIEIEPGDLAALWFLFTDESAAG